MQIYLEIPKIILIFVVEKQKIMEYIREAINAITSQINAFGGTMVIWDGNFVIGTTFCPRGKVTVNYMGYDFIDAKCGDAHIRFPLVHFSKEFLYSLYVEYKNACKENLTENAYNKILEIVERYEYVK